MSDPNKFVLWSGCCRLLLFLPICLCRDTITNLSPIYDSLGDTLVSEGGRFELGFFTPNGTGKRYMGIWYSGSNPRTVVWVANRDNPLPDQTGYIGFARDGNLVVTTKGGSSKNYWTSDLQDPDISGAKAQLLDSGNLILTEGRITAIKWQSFDHPTDTFLPGMPPDSLNLTSWKGPDDPGVGDFTFQKDEESQGQYMISKQQSPYWKTGIYGKFVASDDSFLAQAILGLLNLGTASPPPLPSLARINSTGDYNNTRLRITSDGAIQYLLRGMNGSAWSRRWNEPRERCELISFCGKYGSCNNEDVVPCKCLPGFEPLYRDSWENGNFLDGCKRKSSSGDTFVNFTFMKAGKPSGEGAYVETEFNCINLCLDNKNCQAYSYIVDLSIQRGTPQKTCWRWFDDLDNIQDFAEGGANLSVRVAAVDIAPLTRSCKPCGTNLVPYPLSTGEDCGDPAYSFFTCNSSTGRLHFQALNSNYFVLRVDEETHQFTIRLKNSSECASGSSSISLFPNQTSQFYFRNCSHMQSNFSLDASTGEWLTVVDIGWNLSKVEPLCSTFSDCRDWPQTTCNAGGDGKKRCLCPSNLKWNSTALNCTRIDAYTYQPSAGGGRAGKKPLYLIYLVAIPIIIAVVGFIYRRRNSKAKHVKRQSATVDLERRLYDSERRVKEWISSGQFGEDDKKDIDVPFFDLEVILGATSNFSDENKLGRGGFGPVYKGKFPGGQEIAVKRLLSASGQGLEEFKNEVMLIANLQHRNLVKLLGYCVEGDEKMLLYEYMPNKSLD